MTIFPFVKQISIFSHSSDTYSSVYIDQCKRSTYNSVFFLLQYILSQDTSRPLRQTLEAHSLKLVNSTFSIPQVKLGCCLSTGKAWLLRAQGGVRIMKLKLNDRTSQFAHHEKFSLNFLFFIVCNPCQSSLSKTICLPLWFSVIPLVFFLS